ncbi:hypothetical protein OAS19_06330, partial [Altererythrobacter sp.]|nr:hypothetical protein [Altererythrobacter sp.]
MRKKNIGLCVAGASALALAVPAVLSAQDGGGDFWSTSSKGEVQQRRAAFMAERNAIREANRREREANQRRQAREERLRKEEDARLARM